MATKRAMSMLDLSTRDLTDRYLSAQSEVGHLMRELAEAIQLQADIAYALLVRNMGNR